MEHYMHNFNSYMEVNLNNLCANADYLITSVGAACEMIPVLKGNAYGHGLLVVADMLVKRLGTNTIAVAQVCEGEALRQGGFGGDVMLLAGMPPALAAEAVAERLTVPVGSAQSVRLLSAETKAQGKKYSPVQIVVDTGLNRFGVMPGDDLEALLAGIKQAGNLFVKGVYTHFADAEDPKSRFAYEQLERFAGALAQIDLPASSLKSFTRPTARPASGFRRLF
jgi:alanine racemase